MQFLERIDWILKYENVNNKLYQSSLEKIFIIALSVWT